MFPILIASFFYKNEYSVNTDAVHTFMPWLGLPYWDSFAKIPCSDISCQFLLVSFIRKLPIFWCIWNVLFLLNSFMMTWMVWRNNLFTFRVLFRHKKSIDFFLANTNLMLLLNLSTADIFYSFFILCPPSRFLGLIQLMD